MSTWTLAHPSLLLAAPVAILAVAAAVRRTVSPLPRWRRLLSALVRSAAVLLLAFSMVGPSVTRRQEQPCLTVFLADVSESVPRDAWRTAIPELRRAWDREIAAGNRCALVAFAGRTDVLVPPGNRPLEADLARLSHRVESERLAAAGDSSPALKSWTDRVGTGTTDFPGALAASRALFTEGSTGRIVLVTDGRTALVPAREIELPPATTLVRLESAPRQDVAVVDVAAPTAVRAGEPFDVRVTIHTTAPGGVTLRLSVSDTPEMEQAFTAPSAGRHLVLLKNVQQKRSFTPGLQWLKVLAQAPDDADPRNNLGTAAVTVAGKPRVLLVEGTAGEAEPLARMLQAQDIDLVREPSARIGDRASFEEFVAVVLAGVPRESFGPDVLATLSQYVSSTGGGLFVVGSASLKGDRGYARSEFEKKLLPVAFMEAPAPVAGLPKPDPEVKPDPTRPPPAPDPNAGVAHQVVSPTLAVLFIVDKSGSMAGDAIDIVKKACIGSARNLTAKDYIGVLAFDVKPKWILPFTEGDRLNFIEQSVARLYADGGTNIHPAMLEALRAFRNDSRAKQSAVKHAILLSDGDTGPADFQAVTLKMAEEGITVSAVCIGCGSDKFDAPLMSRIADWGQGRFIFTESLQHVPRIFAQETRRVMEKVPRDVKAPPVAPPSRPPTPAPSPSPPPAGNDAVPIPVVVRDPHEVLQRIAVNALPALKGILPASTRAGAVEVPLATPDGKPVLALWRVGLGKVAVWTSDLSGTWSADWVAWKDSGKLFAQLVRHVYSASPDAELAGRVSVRTRGTEALVRIEPGREGERLSVREAGTSREFPLTREADGRWTVRVPLERAEPSRLLLDRGDGKQLVFGAMRAYEGEYLPADDEHDLFAQTAPVAWKDLGEKLGVPRTSTDHKEDVALWAILAVLLLLPLDVALRRLAA
jgi:Ca-activated chloride channel family protein